MGNLEFGFDIDLVVNVGEVLAAIQTMNQIVLSARKGMLPLTSQGLRP